MSFRPATPWRSWRPEPPPGGSGGTVGRAGPERLSPRELAEVRRELADLARRRGRRLDPEALAALGQLAGLIADGVPGSGPPALAEMRRLLAAVRAGVERAEAPPRSRRHAEPALARSAPPKPHRLLAEALAEGRATPEGVAGLLRIGPGDVAAIAAGRVGLPSGAWRRIMREIEG